jgi:hypothetical protein
MNVMEGNGKMLANNATIITAETNVNHAKLQRLNLNIILLKKKIKQTVFLL